MDINKYVKMWCDEDYDVRDEQFFFDNAKYVVYNQWDRAIAWHRIIILIISAITCFLRFDGIVTGLTHGLSMVAVMTVAFWLKSVTEYDENDPDAATKTYVISLIFLWMLKRRLGTIWLSVMAIVGLFLFIKMMIIDKQKYSDFIKQMGKRLDEMAAEEEKREREEFKRWEEDYKSYRYGLPEFETNYSDPMMDQARHMFDGYTEDKQMLKTRYRQLAKQYHPDKGGDTNLFQCIVAVYEELNKQAA